MSEIFENKDHELERLLAQFATDSIQMDDFSMDGYNYQCTRGYEELVVYINKREKKIAERFYRQGFIDKGIVGGKYRDSLFKDVFSTYMEDFDKND